MSIVITTIFDDPSYPQLPTDLKNPYNFLLPASEAIKMKDELASFLKPFASFADGVSPCQCAGISSKPVHYGFRLNIFVLAISKVLSTSLLDQSGLTEDEWNHLCNSVEAILQKYLGSQMSARKCYKEKYSEEKKFQLRFECYIAFEEHREKVQRKRK